MVTKNKKNKGFTLVEMLVVIVVIGILATIVLVSVSGARKKALATRLSTLANEASKAFETAASTGCKTIGFETDAGGNAVLMCSNPDLSTAYITISKNPPTGSAVITLQLQKGTATLDGSVVSPSWAGINSTQGSSINGGYSFQVGGFTSSETFTCADGIGSRSGCFCSTEGGCSSVN